MTGIMSLRNKKSQKLMQKLKASSYQNCKSKKSLAPRTNFLWQQVCYDQIINSRKWWSNCGKAPL